MNISINITYIGYLIIPLAFIVLIFKPKYLITLLISVSVLHASSVLNGSINNFQYGLSPYYFVAICILLKLLNILLSHRNSLVINSNMKYFTYILLVFWMWSVISAFCYHICSKGWKYIILDWDLIYNINIMQLLSGLLVI